MQVSVTFRNMDPTAALKRYATEKVSKVQRYLNRPADAHVILFTERFRQVAEIVMTANGVPLKCLAKDEDMYAAIDGAVDKLDRQVRKFKEKRKSHRVTQSRRTRRAEVREDVAEARLADATPEPEAPEIRSTPHFVRAPLSPEEAVEEMIRLEAPVLLFKNRRNKRVNVVYRNADGSFGLVEGIARKK